MFKIYYFLIFIVFFGGSCKSIKKNGLDFSNDTYDFNSVQKGDVVRGIFNFKNSSADTITIENISVECNCIFLNKEIPYKIPPNKLDSIIIDFDTSVGEKGYQYKAISIRTNGAPRIYTLKMIGEVE